MSAEKRPTNRSLVYVVYGAVLLLFGAIWMGAGVQSPDSKIAILPMAIPLWLVASVAMAVHWTRNVRFTEQISPLAPSLTKVAFSRLWAEFPAFTLFLSRTDDYRQTADATDFVDRSKIHTVGDVVRDKLTLTTSVLAIVGGGACLAVATGLFPLEFAHRIGDSELFLCLLNLFFSLVAVNGAGVGIFGLSAIFNRRKK